MPKRVSSKTKFTGRVFTIRDVRVRHDDGREFTYEISEKPGLAGSMVCALDDSGRVVLVDEYMAGIDKAELCLPKGKVDAGETPLAAAKRELEEETGYVAGKMELMATVTLSPGYSNQTTNLFLATRISKAKNPARGDEWQAPQVVLMPLEKAISLALKGKITEARAVAALLLAKEKIVKNGKGRKRKKKK